MTEKSKMTVSEEWRGHACQLRKIREDLKRRPTLGLDRHIKALNNLATALDREAENYEGEYEQGA